jgi:hypothetical protein
MILDSLTLIDKLLAFGVVVGDDFAGTDVLAA